MKNISHGWFIGIAIALLIGLFVYVVEYSGKVNKYFDYDKEVYNQLETEYSKIEKIKTEITELENNLNVINTYNKTKLFPTNNIIGDSLKNILRLNKTNIESDIKSKKVKLTVLYEAFFTNLTYAKEMFGIEIDEVSKDLIKYHPEFYFNEFEYSSPNYQISIDGSVRMKSIWDEFSKHDSLIYNEYY